MKQQIAKYSTHDSVGAQTTVSVFKKKSVARIEITGGISGNITGIISLTQFVRQQCTNKAIYTFQNWP